MTRLVVFSPRLEAAGTWLVGFSPRLEAVGTNFSSTSHIYIFRHGVAPRCCPTAGSRRDAVGGDAAESTICFFARKLVGFYAQATYFCIQKDFKPYNFSKGKFVEFFI